MSAYLESKIHIDALLTAGLHFGRNDLRWWVGDVTYALDHETVDRVGAMLVNENLKSVSYRYNDEPAASLPGPIDKLFVVDAAQGIYHFERTRDFTPVEILKAICGYQYQTCEHPDWQTSEAFAFCEALRELMVHRLPGYEEADTWEITDRGLAPHTMPPVGRVR